MKMAGPGTFVSIALAFALVFLSVSVCKCETVTFSRKSDVLTENERENVLTVLQAMVDNVERDIHLYRDYYTGRLFTKYINLNEKGVVIRLTRWSSECSVSMSSSDTTKGSDLVEAFKRMLPTILPYLMRGHEWVAVSNHTDWMDYYVRKPYNGEKEAPIQLGADGAAYKILSDGLGSSVTDCAIQPTMLLSHHSALAFNQMRPGDSLYSPDRKYKLTIPQSGDVMAPCVLNLEDQNGKILWQSGPNRPVPQNDCTLAFRSDGTLELWNGKYNRIWFTDSACASVTKCAGASSLALKDGDIKLYRSLDDHLSSYWSARRSN